MSEAIGQSGPNQPILRRGLSAVSSAAVTYSTVGASLGMFTLFGFALASAGGASYWGWLTVAVLVLPMVLIFAELASHYPIAGVMAEWPKLLIGPRTGWWFGWLYLWAAVLLLSSWYLAVSLVVITLFGWSGTVAQEVEIGFVALFVALVVNVAGIEVLGQSTKWAVAVELGITLGLSVLILASGRLHPENLVQLGGAASFGDWLPGFVAGGVFVGIWVLFTFECSGTLGEETVDAKRQAPKGVLGSFAATVIVGIIFLGVMVLATPSIATYSQSAYPIPAIISAALPKVFGTVYLVLLIEVAILGANAQLTAASRQLYGMARDGDLPFSAALTRLWRGTPVVAVVVCAVIGALPFFFATSFLVLATALTAFFYVTYVGVLVAVLVARLRGWPREAAPFSLGRFGIPVNVAAIAFSAAILLDLLWFRPSTNPTWQFGIPVAFWLVGIPLVVGLAYYMLAQRRRLSQLSQAVPQVAESSVPSS
jgi:amino acid transporter